MFRKIFRAGLVICLLAAPIAMASCAREHTTIDTYEQQMGKTEAKPVVTPDAE